MKIVFATNNEHKLSEIRSILGDSIEVLSLKDIGCDADIPETGKTLELTFIDHIEEPLNIFDAKNFHSHMLL